MKKVVVGFSGGIDSTATALMLREAGYAVRLLTLQTTDATESIERACRRAEQLNFPWESLDIRTLFQQEIIHYFLESYRRGETPSPCAVCNARIKWPLLYQSMCRRGDDYLATGHYVRIERIGRRFFVRQGIDPHKDQSYYLWDLPQVYLQKALTPLGPYHKSDILCRYASTAPPKESMSLCFLKGYSCTEFLKTHLSVTPGDIVDETGRTIGRHEGYALYTIGQKKGLQLDRKEAVVTGIDPLHNRLQVGLPSDLLHNHLILRSYRITDRSILNCTSRFSVRIRGVGHNPHGYARLIRKTSRELHLQLEEPAWAAALGQPVVLYGRDRVVGGGILQAYF